jgi:LmeA-like phospholipid-binding
MSTDDTQPMRTPVQPGQQAQAAQPEASQQPYDETRAYSQQQYGEPQDDRPYTRPYEQQPQYAQPQYAQPQYAQPQYEQPQYAQPQDKPLRFGRTRRRRRVRRSVIAVFTILVLAILLTIGDRVANAIAENDMAGQFTANGFPVKPSVTIEGFPFLTQLAVKDFKKVDISASNIPAGPVTIDTMHATITGMHISSFSNSASARVDHVTATAFISFGALAAAGGLGGGTGITITQDGTNKLKITAGIGGIFSDSEEAEITQSGPQTISIKILNSGGVVGSLLSAFGAFSFTLPQGVPASLRITGLTLNAQGLTVSAAANNATFSK